MLACRLLGLCLFCVALCLLAGSFAQSEEPKSQTFHVYVGTYTGAKSKGIYLFELDAATGQLTPKGLAGEATNPSFLAIHPSKKFLYAVGEVASVGRFWRVSQSVPA